MKRKGGREKVKCFEILQTVGRNRREQSIDSPAGNCHCFVLNGVILSSLHFRYFQTLS